MSEEERKKIAELEQRISKLEQLRDVPQTTKPVEEYNGIAGGIRFLIANNFFDSPRTLNDVINELKREGYTLTTSGVASTLSTTFTLKQKTLSREKDKDGWRYKKRK